MEEREIVLEMTFGPGDKQTEEGFVKARFLIHHTHTHTHIPVHMMSIPESSSAPICWRYSDPVTVGTALDAQYSTREIRGKKY